MKFLISFRDAGKCEIKWGSVLVDNWGDVINQAFSKFKFTEQELEEIASIEIYHWKEESP